MSTEQAPTGIQPTRGSGGTDSRLANRYGTPKPGMTQRRKKTLIIVALVLTVLITAVFTALFVLKPVSSQDVGFSIGGDDLHAVVDYRVTKDPDATVECGIQVLSEDYAVVAWKTVRIGPADATTTAQRTQLRLESPGVSGGVDSCWVVDSAR